MHRLVAVGDSLTMGFKSGAIYDTENSYPAIIAHEMGLRGDEFRFPDFKGKGGLPFNLEYFLRKLDHLFGKDINGFDYLRAPFLIREWMDDTEDYWERGRGTNPSGFKGSYHNLAVWGFEIQDAYDLTAGICKNTIQQGSSDEWLKQIPDHAMLRSAYRVLNPAQDSTMDDMTQIRHVEKMANEGEGEEKGIENLIVCLGSNNVLGTVTNLIYSESVDQDLETFNPENRAKPDYKDFKTTIYTTKHFQQAFDKLVAEIDQIVSNGGVIRNIFIGNVPYVTIPPVSHGVNGRFDSKPGSLESPYIDDHDSWYRRYFRYYTRPWITDRFFKRNEDPYLPGEKIIQIDNRITEYNDHIRSVVSGKDNWHLVDINNILDRMAFRRYVEDPSVPPPPEWAPYDLPDACKALELDTRFLVAKQGKRKTGGYFSLDGIHPTTVTYGILAQEFINVMQDAGVEFFYGNPRAGSNGKTKRVGRVNVDFQRLLSVDSLMGLKDVEKLPFTLDDVWNLTKIGDQGIDLFKRVYSAF